MKVLHIQHVKGIAGSEKYIFHLCREQKRLGHNPAFLCAFKPQVKKKLLPFFTWFEKEGIPIFPLPISGDLTWKTLREISSLIKANRYDLIHSHLIHADLWITLCKQIFRLKLPVVSTKHGYDESYIQQYGLSPENKIRNKYYYLAKWAEKGIHTSICVSKGIASLYEGLGIIAEGASKVVHHGLNIQSTPPPNRVHRFSSFQLVIVGRLVGFKGHSYIFKAVKALLPKYPKLILVLIGDGEDRIGLEEEVKRLGIQNQVKFLGFQSDPIHYMSNSDVVCIPSIAEPFGLVFLEAFEAGTPVLAFDVPAGNEILIPEESGVLIPAFDMDVLERKLNFLLANPSYRKELAIKAKERLHTYFTLDRMALQTQEVYDEVMKHKKVAFASS